MKIMRGSNNIPLGGPKNKKLILYSEGWDNECTMPVFVNLTM